MRSTAALPGAQEGLDRLAARRSADAYSVAMSRGFAEAAAGRTDAARTAFNQALAARPGSREAAGCRRSARPGPDAPRRCSLLEARARTAESDERWDEALTAWREAAGLEPTLESAREGLARATPRAELQRRIDALNAKPGTPVERGGPGGGAGPVAAAAAAGNPRERLAASAARARTAGRRPAQSPIRLRLESDGQTQVVIYRVGQYGSFATRDVELLPGRYTVVGTRTGFRDVRREVVLPPGAASAGGGRQMRGADLKDVWLEDPLGERKLAPSELPLTVGGPGAAVVIPGCRPGEMRARVALAEQGIAVTPEPGAGPDALDGVAHRRSKSATAARRSSCATAASRT